MDDTGPSAGEERRECEEATAARENLEWQLQVSKEAEARLTVELSHANKAVLNMWEALEDARGGGEEAVSYTISEPTRPY